MKTVITGRMRNGCCSTTGASTKGRTGFSVMVMLLVIVTGCDLQFSSGIALCTIPAWQACKVQHEATEYEEKYFHQRKYRNIDLKTGGCHAVAKRSFYFIRSMLKCQN